MDLDTEPAAVMNLLRCPETMQRLQPAPEPLMAELRRLQKTGELKLRNGNPLQLAPEAGLLRSDGQVLYLIQSGIPIMLIEESIDLAANKISIS
jgi:uncharacterized protein